MEVLTKEGSQEVFAVTIGDSTVYIPEDFDPKENLGSFTWKRIETTVPITDIWVSLMSLLKLIEWTHQRLVDTGHPKLAKQILPRGGQNESI